MSERFHLWKCERYKACDDERPPVALLSSASADFTLPHLQEHRPKAVGHRDLSASKRTFSSNTSSKSRSRRQPCRGFSSRLAKKISLFEVRCSFAAKIFSCSKLRGCSNTYCIARTRRKRQGKRWLQNRINPYDQPPNLIVWDVFLSTPG